MEPPAQSATRPGATGRVGVPVSGRGPLGAALLARRRELGMSCSAVAIAAGVSQGLVSMMERGAYAPRTTEETVRALARALQTDPVALLDLAGVFEAELADYVHSDGMAAALREARRQGLTGRDLLCLLRDGVP